MDDAGRLALDLAGDLDRDLPSMLELVERLVSIDSGSHDRRGVEAVSETMATALAERGFEVRRTAIPDTPTSSRRPQAEQRARGCW